jgi:hypothetical protein
MLAFVLTILALAGGVSVTFFVMDSPRRQAQALRRRLDEEHDLLRREQRENDEWSRSLRAQSLDLKAAEETLARRRTEFDRRAVSYDELLAENRLLKADLSNMALLVAQREQQVNATEQFRQELLRQRESLGQQYLEAVREAVHKSVTATNYLPCKRRLEEAVANLATAGVRPTAAGERQMQAELKKRYELAVRAAAEREEQARMREQIREEQRLERESREAAQQAERAERERQAVERALNEALAKASGAHAAEVEGLRAKLKAAEEEARSKFARSISLAQITKTGHVYVISNIGSFGTDVYKIGMTRRQYPMDRVHELGDASVPFPFDVHMMIKCNDAPKLEKALHRAFHRRRMNRVNPRKEFFRVTIDEIVKAVRANHGEVGYRADAEALEYLQSQQVTDADLDEVEQVYEEAEEDSPEAESGED